MTRTSSSSPPRPAPATGPAAPTPRRAPTLTGPRLRRIVEKIGGAVVVLFGAATAAFAAQAALPGDRATVILNIRAGQAIERTPAELAQINEQYGLQNPLVVQYLDYIRGLLVGDLGISYQQFKPVSEVILQQIGPTVALTLTAIVLSWLIMITWVTLTAGRTGRLAGAGAVVDTTAAGLPHYWLGIILLLVFSLGLGWFPVISGPSAIGIVLPALTLAIPLAGFMGQATRTEFERSLEQPFVISARMRGMGDTGVRLRHVLRHSVLPAITLSGWALGATISGAVVVETVFSRPGIGKVLVGAVNSQDLPVVTGIVILIAALYVMANLLVDVAYTLVDPRLKSA
ncbi:ABC transporter permease [Cryobacterium arcticum]|uniref:ABC transporter permease n=1 Tax=Cryobacterium arcticum TaxID=670052 RepID=A0A1B1BHA9_9MICO|nr:ABC transporter permease [Cryobacterium arcticum]ANP71938.1 ABC transporter permease [Cryobacterium arcticum]